MYPSLWKMVNKDMNGFPVKKCSAFQFFKKRVRFSFNSFFSLSFFVVVVFVNVLEQRESH